MRIVTRKQHLAFEAAQAVPPQAGKRIRTQKNLQELVELVMLNPAHAAFVDSMDIFLLSAFLPSTLRRSLILLPNLTDLILVAPRLRSSAALRGIVLPQLQYLRTDLPHALLVGFLAANPTITTIDLVRNSHTCSLPCPIQTVDLSNCESLSGPACCVARLARPGLKRLTMELDKSSSGSSIPLRTIAPPLSQLYVLIIDVYDEEYDILDAIATACPAVQKLKLVVKPSNKSTRAVSRRAYNDARAWSRALRRLRQLEELLFRTSSSLMRKPGDRDHECKLVLSWVNGPSQARPRPHPMLYHVGIWYGFGPSGGGCVTHWSKPSGIWERTCSVMDPPADHLFI